MITPDKPRRRWFRFSLKTLLVHLVPCSAVCILVLTCCREPVLGIGAGVPVFDWVGLVAVAVIAGLWIVLFQEDKRARRRQDAERPPHG